VDLTDRVKEVISDVGEGVAHIMVKHTTCALVINEAERGLMRDYLEWATRLIPPDAEFHHNEVDNNGYAHLLASIFGNSRCVPVLKGQLVLGTWQRVILLEFDGPREREVMIAVTS